MSATEDFPEELTDTVKNFHGSLTELKSQLEVQLDRPREELYTSLEPLARAKMDLVSAYAINSLMWMLLKTQVLLLTVYVTYRLDGVKLLPSLLQPC